MGDLPFVYLKHQQVADAIGCGSVNGLLRMIREGRFPKPDYINGRARHRSDRVAEWLREQAAKADAERERDAAAARARGRRMRAARGHTTAAAKP